MDTESIPRPKPSPTLRLGSYSVPSSRKIQRISTAGWPFLIYLPPAYRTHVFSSIEKAEIQFEEKHVSNSELSQFRSAVMDFLIGTVGGFVRAACHAENAQLLSFEDVRGEREAFFRELVSRVDIAKCASHRFLLDFHGKIQSDVSVDVHRSAEWRQYEDALIASDALGFARPPDNYKDSDSGIRLSATEMEGREAMISLVSGSHKGIAEAFSRESLGRQLGISPENVTLEQIRNETIRLRGEGDGWRAVNRDLTESEAHSETSSSEEHRDVEVDPVGDLKRQRAKLLAAYKAATGNPSNKKIYESRNSNIHKPRFLAWRNGNLPPSSATTGNFERFLREKKPPIPKDY